MVHQAIVERVENREFSCADVKFGVFRRFSANEMGIRSFGDGRTGRGRVVFDEFEFVDLLRAKGGDVRALEDAAIGSILNDLYSNAREYNAKEITRDPDYHPRSP